jgi:hypothetical protein
MGVPIPVVCAIYDLAKLCMLEFYYDFIDKCIGHTDFVYCQMDTDSAYIVFSGEHFEDLIETDLENDYLQKHLNGFQEMIQKNVLNSIRERLVYSKRNIEAHQ